MQHQIQMEAPPSPLSSRAKPRDLQFYRPVLEMFFEEAVWALRVCVRTRNLPIQSRRDRPPDVSPARQSWVRLGKMPSPVGTAEYLHPYSVEKHFQDGPAEL